MKEFVKGKYVLSWSAHVSDTVKKGSLYEKVTQVHWFLFLIFKVFLSL